MKKFQYYILIFALIFVMLGGVNFDTASSIDAPTLNEAISVATPPDKPNNKEEEITEYIYQDLEEYVKRIDYNNLNLSGDGSKDNPFQVNSTEDFLWLMSGNTFDVMEKELSEEDEGESNYSYEGKYKLKNNSYIEINSDIYINDETFDINGNPSGGDGVVCNWLVPITQLTGVNVNGNSNTIYNYYAKTTDTATGSFARHLFARSPGIVKLVTDLNFSGIYVYGGSATYASVLGYRVDYVYNCNVLSGNVVGKGEYLSALAGLMYIEAKNCNNYANVYSYYQWVAGLFVNLYGNVSQCNNYGNVSVSNAKSSNGRAAGIVSIQQNGSFIEYCNNYGDITSVDQEEQMGGIVAWGRESIKNCKNYGAVRGGASIGGISGFVASNNITIDSCENYGDVQSLKAFREGEIVGWFYSDKAISEGTVTISNCYAEAHRGHGFFGQSNKTKTIIKNCKINYVKDINTLYALHRYVHVKGNNIEYSNIEVNILGKVTGKAYLFNSATASGYDSSDVTLRNVIINSKHSVTFGFLQYKPETLTKIDGLIINIPGSKQYYGTNFSGFYTSWKTGKIGLIRLDGRGNFQGEVNEEVLARKGYTKIA